MAGGMGVPGLTSVDHSPLTSPPSTSITAISVMRSQLAFAPVVSRSTMASGASSSGMVDIRPVRRISDELRELPRREAEYGNAGYHVYCAQRPRPEAAVQASRCSRQDQPPRRRAEEYAERHQRRRGVARTLHEAEAGEDRGEGEDGRRVGERQAERGQKRSRERRLFNRNID